jgi:hypothetical protein
LLHERDTLMLCHSLCIISFISSVLRRGFDANKTGV